MSVTASFYPGVVCVIKKHLYVYVFFYCVEILSQDLQAGAEDERDYDAPDEGNLLYKLYSLQDLLLLVRSSVSLTHTRKVGSQNQVTPSHNHQLHTLLSYTMCVCVCVYVS